MGEQLGKHADFLSSTMTPPGEWGTSPAAPVVFSTVPDMSAEKMEQTKGLLGRRVEAVDAVT